MLLEPACRPSGPRESASRIRVAGHHLFDPGELLQLVFNLAAGALRIQPRILSRYQLASGPHAAAAESNCRQIDFFFVSNRRTLPPDRAYRGRTDGRRSPCEPQPSANPLSRRPEIAFAQAPYNLPVRSLLFIRQLTVLATLLMAAWAYGQAPLGMVPRPAIPNVKPVRSCQSLTTAALPNTTIASAALDPADPAVCRVTAIATHPPTGDKVTIWIAIPMAHWNGRFLGTGGGGFLGGYPAAMNQPVILGYAAGATDTGHAGGSGSFALDPNGRLNWQAIRDNAHVGIHDMTVTGKALVEAIYGVAPRYSYFDGCSTGGRQGLMEAQRYPQDYDGIVSGAPAINWPKLMMQSMWGTLQEEVAQDPLSACKLAAATAAAVQSCDALDGVKDGVIEDPARCHYDPKALIGTPAGACGVFTQADAEVIHKIWQGPRREDGSFLWYGQARGADLRPLAAAQGSPLKPRVFPFTVEWLRYFITENPQFDWTTVTPAAYQRFWDQSVEEYGTVIGTDNPDLTAFRDRGGKAIVWHGWADQLIATEGTIDYYRRVEQRMGGAERTSAFMRLFLAPGVGHCGGGAGPSPHGELDALRSWVEDGRAPAILSAARRNPAGAVTRSRPLCPYPLVAKYKGVGSTDDAANFVCSAGF
jgi:Tannase and feruloyl esterase